MTRTQTATIALPVLFRIISGEVTACFPTIPGTSDPWTMDGYVHDGQHICIDAIAVRRARNATPAERAGLLRELEGIYTSTPGTKVSLVVLTRFDWQGSKAAREAAMAPRKVA